MGDGLKLRISAIARHRWRQKVDRLVPTIEEFASMIEDASYIPKLKKPGREYPYYPGFGKKMFVLEDVVFVVQDDSIAKTRTILTVFRERSLTR